MYVIVAGGGKVGYFLSKKLIEEKHEVLLVEKDPKKSVFISEELGEIVYEGDGCEMKNMQEMGMERADVVVAVTGDDEDNLVICQLAKRKFNVPRTIARVNNPKNEEIFKKLGIDETVSSTKIIYNLIEREVDEGNVISILPLGDGNLEIVEATLKKTSPAVNKKISDLHISGDAVLVSIIRDNTVLIPRGDIELKENDTILAVTITEKEPLLQKILGGNSNNKQREKI